MKNKIVKKTNDYSNLIDSIGDLLSIARQTSYKQINNLLVRTNWEIGRQIVEFEQKGQEKAEYGSNLLNILSRDLTSKYGKGFSRRNVLDMRRFYICFSIWQTVSAELSWSHYSTIISVGNELARSFYEKQCINEKWSVRELRRHIDTALFERIALSKKPDEVYLISKKGLVVSSPDDLIKDPYVFEFLNIPKPYKISEKVLESKLIENLQKFILELGKGFAFIARQYRIPISNDNFYVDLVFYHRILKCFVLIDLKIGKANHQDIGQMNMYLNYFKAEESEPDDNEPIGIILAADKNDVLIEYALGGISNKLFISKYKLYLPDKKQLEEKIKYFMKDV